jgi:hypothetical protein
MPLDSDDTDARLHETDSPVENCGADDVLDLATVPAVSSNPWLVAFLALLFVGGPIVRAYLRRR